MNAYLSREEKEKFIRLSALVGEVEELIGAYAKAKSTDKSFLKFLRTGRTMVGKALDLRMNALDPEAQVALLKQISHLEFMFLPKPEADAAYKKIKEMKSTLPMDLHDFEDWYCAVIETTCKHCCSEQYTECQIRRVLTTYGVYPIDPGAVGKCQYSYVGTPEAEELQPAEAETVPAEKYNQAVAELAALKEKLAAIAEDMRRYEKEREALNSYSHKLEQQCDEWKYKAENVKPAESQPDPEGITVTIGLRNGKQFELRMSEYLAIDLLTELERPNRDRALCSCHFGDEAISVDMQDVVLVQAAGVADGTWPQPAEFSYQPTAPEYEDTGERELYRVECRCGAEYICSMNPDRDKARCRDCHETVFADRKAQAFTETGVQATLLTNRYFVEKERPAAPVSVERPNPKTNIGKDYEDPLASLVG